MYLAHYNLKRKPFQISADPRFLWLGEGYKEAFATLKYGIQDSRGFLLLTGDVGTGKTTLINALRNSLTRDVVVASIADPSLGKIDFFRIVSNAFNLNGDHTSKGTFILNLTKFLESAYTNKKKVLLIIDESQRLTQTLLEEIRLLSNIEKQHTKLLNIFFVGQSEFNEVLLRHENSALRQRITISYSIEALTEGEIEKYIRHRLSVAGTERIIFSPDAIREVYNFSQGYPRLINVICDHALLTGYVKGTRSINGKVVKECARELTIEAPKSKKRFKKKPKRKRKISWGKIVGYAALTAIYLIVAAFLFYSVKQNREKFESLQLEISRNQAKVVNKVPPQADMKEAPKAVSQPLNLSKEDRIIYFPKRDQKGLPPSAFSKLDQAAAYLLQNPQLRLVVEGHTDSLGIVSDNKSMSEFWANLVKAYLAGKGIDPAKIQAMGRGPANPIQKNDNERGRSANRRVELKFISP